MSDKAAVPGDKRRTSAQNRSKDDDSEEDEEFHEEDGGHYIGGIYIPPPPPPPKFSGEHTGTRLVITHIENVNFKSYAGTQILGPFHKSFTSIVGPNGSGKSNVIDSMLFVFGYRATKLRSKKLSILIHNSDTHPNLTSCEVKVHFSLIDDKGGEDYDLVPDSNFVVSRTASKDNSSNYFVGSKKVQFKEVSQLLQSHGIDLRYNRFLILQGEVEQIALMKPKAENENDPGMLEFLEDIIGSTRLKAPLTMLQTKVEETNELRAEKLNRVKVVEKEKEALEGPRNDALKFLGTQNALSLKKNEFFQLQKAEADEERASAHKLFERAENIYKEALEEINKVVERKTKQEEEIRVFHADYTTQSEKADSLKESFKELERRDVQYREQIKHTKTKGKKLVADQEKESGNLEKLKEQPSTLAAEIATAKERKAECESSKEAADEKLTKAMGKLKHETEKLQEEKDKYEHELLDLQKGVTDARSKKELAQSEFDLYVSKEKTEKAKLDQLRFKYDSTEKEIETCKSQIELLEDQIPKVEKEHDKLCKDIERTEVRQRELTTEHRSNDAKLSEMKSTANSFNTRNRLLKAVMDANSKGTLKGVIGRLGDLGAIEKKYDIAISTACGPLDNIVTDTMDSAQKVIEFIKSRDLGKVTCMALDKIYFSDNHMNHAEKNSENIPRLFDLVQINDERVRPAFYKALKNTLVAKDLEQATNVRGRHRIVTLDGKMIEPSGSMSGGGRPSSGRMGTSIAVSSTSDQDIRELEAVVQESREELAGLSEKLTRVHREVEQLKTDLQTMKARLPKLLMDLEAKKHSLTELTKSISSQEKNFEKSAPDPKRAKELQKNVTTLESVYDSVSAEANELEEKIEGINQNIKDIMDKTVGAAKKIVEKLKTELHSLDTEITKKGVAQKTASRNIEKSEEKLKGIEQEIEESTKLIATLKEDIKKLEKEASAQTDQWEAAVAEKEAMEEKLKGLQSALNKLKSEETKLKSENVDSKHEVEKHGAVLREKEAEVKTWDGKISALELHRIDEVPADAIESLPVLTPGDLETLNSHSLKNDIDNLEKELKKMKPNMSAIVEYKKKDALYLERFKELTDVTERRDMFKAEFEQLRTQRMSEFKEGFTIITRKLKEMYRMITAGGDAELEWSDSLDPFSEGINFSVRPNKKSWKRISNLSGGEKTLSSLALIFALHYYKPSPLYVMDEIDAALDFKNVSIVANYIKERTRNTQFIIISLRNNMYELADRLVGIYKTHNCTKSVTVMPEAIEEKRKKTVDLTSASCTPRKESEPSVDTTAASSVFA